MGLLKTCFLSNITIFVFTVLDIFRTEKQTHNLGKIYAARCCVRLQAPRLFLDRTLLLCLCRFFIPGLKFTTCSKLICFFQLINFIISFIIISSCDKKYFYHYNPWFLLLSFKRTNQVIWNCWPLCRIKMVWDTCRCWCGKIKYNQNICTVLEYSNFTNMTKMLFKIFGNVQNFKGYIFVVSL